MNIGLRWMAVGALAGLITAGGASAASPVGGKLYTGTGKDFMNNAPRWATGGTGEISFKTSKSGAAVTDFRGGYSYYCGSGTATVTETRMLVSSKGRFGARFTVRTRGPNGKVNGRAYVEISGAFKADGAKATVSYLVDYVFKGRHVRHPYATGHPKRLGCASWVRGTANAK
jgi:hypothetical protein